MIHHGDCLTVMAGMPEASVDAIVTDPPYGLSFMGKAWDHGVPGEPFWSEALRVAKPGAHLLAFGGTRTFHRLTCAIEDAGWEIRDCIMWVYGSGFPKSHNIGSLGTALKPAWEPIIVARKPIVGTVAQNVQTFGTGAINVDACRVGAGGGGWNGLGSTHDESQWRLNNPDGKKRNEGRWPANLIHDGSEEVASLFPASAGAMAAKSNIGRTHGFKGARRSLRTDDWGEPLDALGSAARFFYCAKASPSDRSENGTVENKHPTVKPSALMRYLVKLVTPPNGTVLDPFCGSGSTGKAAILEGFKFIGIERDADSAATAEARCAANQSLFEAAS